MMIHNRFVAGLSLAVTLALSSAASAATWTEVGDAGQLPATAQTPLVSGPLTSIRGNISTSTDVDMYRILLNGLAPFSATTVGTPGTLADTQLFLFNSQGLGLLFNDDDPSGTTFRSTLPATNLPAGTYYLAISGFDVDPMSPGGDIFPEVEPLNTPHNTEVFGPTGPGGAQAVSSWGQDPDTTGGTYTINLTGVSTGVPTVPEPASLALLATGALPLLRRRRKSQVIKA